MPKSYLSKTVVNLKASGIRKFFDIAATMEDVISLGIGEPDFTTPQPVIEAGVQALRKGETHYTSNQGIMELRAAIAENLAERYGVHYDPVNEIIVTVGVSEASISPSRLCLTPGTKSSSPHRVLSPTRQRSLWRAGNRSKSTQPWRMISNQTQP